jgi:hypothetical protein
LENQKEFDNLILQKNLQSKEFFIEIEKLKQENEEKCKFLSNK